ncbi:MAG: hypothetical protein OEZ01_04550, partial [Candidatus Heimdallarchaeota archaeon]|nr:hypothetical protein [Candidatus Heimdallarchaeota archaeon]
MFIILRVWRKFTPKYAPNIIYWTTKKKFTRKLIAGGSFSYYEYKTNPDKIGLFQPVSRFLNLMIAFLGVSSSIASIANLKPESPVSSFGSMLVWGLLILLIPLVLTPVIPVIWAMEDLGLKAWNDKMKT